MATVDVLDSIARYLDLHQYQQNEISDSVCNLLNVTTALLEEDIQLCSDGLPNSGDEFKMFLRQFYKQSVHLRHFELDIGPTHTTVRCRVVYGTNTMVSHPLFYFSNRIFRSVELLKKQLKNLSFTYKITKSHFFFQIMNCEVGSGIFFYYNATLDKYACPPTGMSYSKFLNRYKNKIVFYNNCPASASPATGSQFSAEAQQPQCSYATFS